MLCPIATGFTAEGDVGRGLPTHATKKVVGCRAAYWVQEQNGVIIHTAPSHTCAKLVKKELT